MCGATKLDLGGEGGEEGVRVGLPVGEQFYQLYQLALGVQSLTNTSSTWMQHRSASAASIRASVREKNSVPFFLTPGASTGR